MILDKHFARLDDAKAEAAAQSKANRMAWVVDHVEDYQEEDYLVVVGDSEKQAPGAFLNLFISGVEQPRADSELGNPIGKLSDENANS